ncbi:MAG: hypothetical protein H6621_03120 [Halobacteriovoraceae bacterium]|nr:hypothetical protein [Halobacteriovoraceae bacterium]MCB9094037.1 hypothetical protein [Halobacteriovoraceae bacterium]
MKMLFSILIVAFLSSCGMELDPIKKVETLRGFFPTTPKIETVHPIEAECLSLFLEEKDPASFETSIVKFTDITEETTKELEVKAYKLHNKIKETHLRLWFDFHVTINPIIFTKTVELHLKMFHNPKNKVIWEDKKDVSKLWNSPSNEKAIEMLNERIREVTPSCEEMSDLYQKEN